MNYKHKSYIVAAMMIFLNVALLLGAIYIGQALFRWGRNRRRLVRLINKLPGPKQSLPALENCLMIMQHQEIAKQYKLDSYVLTYSLAPALTRAFIDKGLLCFWLSFKPVVVLYSPETIEPILTNPRVLNKSDEYFVFEPWLGEGLVTSKRNKWQVRRKILTPAFHFRILNDFLPIINKEASRLVRKLNQSKYLDGQFDIMPLVALCTLDTICETAMGTSISDETGDGESSYVRALYEVGEMTLARVTRPWLWPDFLYYRTEFGRKFVKARDLMHAFTQKVIKERKQQLEDLLEGLKSENSDGKFSFQELQQIREDQKTHKRMAFLDLLLHQHLIEKTMSLSDVQEEADTFMFAVSIWSFFLH